MRTDGVHRRSLDDLEVAKGREVETEVLQCVGGLVDQEDVYRSTRQPLADAALGVYSPRIMSNPCILTYASAYMGSEKPVSFVSTNLTARHLKRRTGELRYPAEIRDEVLLYIARTGRPYDILVILHKMSTHSTFHTGMSHTSMISSAAFFEN